MWVINERALCFFQAAGRAQCRRMVGESESAPSKFWYFDPVDLSDTLRRGMPGATFTSWGKVGPNKPRKQTQRERDINALSVAIIRFKSA